MNDGWRASLQTDLSARYEFRRELGGGGMSATFIADEVALGRTVVIKALPPSLAGGLNSERFEREIRVAARLQHAFLVPLLSAGTCNGTPWYTMPLVQGESLRERLSREGAMPANVVARLLRDVAEALAYAHGQGVVHRDIKPGNILLSGAHALVTDFGVAKALAASTSHHAYATGTGVAMGTPAYMAPE
ncbi:MAG TPA: serine/threonine-protein kinase, partial [Gemmatimonadaceae bacterium]